MSDVTDKLLADGLASFQKSFDTLHRRARRRRRRRSGSELRRREPHDRAVTHATCATAERRSSARSGPSSSSREALRSLMEAGLNVARINFSHGTHEQHAATIALVRDVAAELGRPVAILGDLQGPRIRIGDLPAPRRRSQTASDVVLVPEERREPATRFPSRTRRSPTTCTSATASSSTTG